MPYMACMDQSGSAISSARRMAASGCSQFYNVGGALDIINSYGVRVANERYMVTVDDSGKVEWGSSRTMGRL